MGLVRIEGEVARLEPVAATYLVKGRPAYYGDWALAATLEWNVLGRLAESVRTGRAIGGDLAAGGDHTEQTWRAHTRPVLAEWPERARDARDLWQHAGIAPAAGTRFDVLDPACGPGVTSFTLAKDYLGVHVTGVDFGPVLETTRAIAQAMQVEDRVTLVEGDLKSTDLGSSRYDLVLLGRILYYLDDDAAAEVLARAHTALRPRGSVIIHEARVDAERGDTSGGALAALMLLAFAPNSHVRAFSDYRDLLTETGFHDIREVSETVIRAAR
jgi:SAM-dependent methyltransferase